MVIVKRTNFKNKIPDNFTGKIIFNKCVIFIKKNFYHRYYGPATIWYDGDKSWNFNGEEYGSINFYFKTYNQKQFIKDLNKQWLF